MIQWKAAEFIYYPKDAGWYVINFVIVALCVVLALWQKNFLLIVFVVIAEILILVWSSRVPREVEFELTAQYMSIDNELRYELKNLHSFDIREGEEVNELVFLQKTKFRPILKVPLPKEFTSKVKEFLLQFLPEEEIGDSILDSISKLIGF